MQAMNPSKTLLLLLFLVLIPVASINASEYHAFRVTGSDCTLCHGDEAASGELNDTGVLYEEEGYEYPLTRKQSLFYFIGGFTRLIIVYGFFRRYRLWRLGKGKLELTGGTAERWKGLISNAYGHETLLKNPFAGASHLALFWSFTILVLLVVIILLQEYVLLPLAGVRIINETIYPYFRLLLDISGLTGFIGTLLLGYRRYIQKPKELDNQPTDAISLLLLFLVFFTGLLVTGVRNHLYESEFLYWAPAASSIGWLFKAILGEGGGLKTCFDIIWWAHPILAFVFFVSIPFSRLFHLVSSPLNIFFRNLGPKGALPMLEIAASETFGAGRIEDFAWKHLLELDACTRCGRCQENCPALISEKHLNPKSVVQNLKRHMEGAGRQGGVDFIGGVVSEDEIWECTTCLNCVEHCPVYIEPMAKIIEMRRNCVLTAGNIPSEFKQMFKNLEIFGDPKGKGKLTREGWTSNLNIPKVYEPEQDSPIDILFWTGCMGALYDERSKRTTLAVANTLQKAGINFGILGKEELCCGDPARRMGNEYLFQELAKKNIDILQKYGVKKVVTHCPHCFNVFKKEYAALGADFEVLDFFELIKAQFNQGNLKANSTVDASFTYHDPCYLGRYNSMYEQPREILKSFLGLNIIEMDRIKEKSFCCGAGGGNMWRGVSAGKRMEGLRIEEAVKTQANGIITACPYCDIMFESAIKQEGLEYSFKLVNLFELVDQATNE